MNTARTDASGRYSVAVDNQSPYTVDGFQNSQSTAATCGFGWSTTDLQNTQHTVIVTTLGQSADPAANGKSASTFELDGFV